MGCIGNCFINSKMKKPPKVRTTKRIPYLTARLLRLYGSRSVVRLTLMRSTDFAGLASSCTCVPLASEENSHTEWKPVLATSRVLGRNCPPKRGDLQSDRISSKFV